MSRLPVVALIGIFFLPLLCLAESDYQNPSGNYNYNYNYNRPFNWNYSNTQMFINHNWSNNRAPIITYQPPKTNINVNRTIDNLNKFVIIPNSNAMGTGAFAGGTMKVKVDQSVNGISQSNSVYTSSNSVATAQDPVALSSQEIISNNTIPGTGSSSNIAASSESQAAYKIEDITVK
ncbi:MAG: hypothetical protein PHG40_02375 [Candidatus Omnitrophica bacterium]|nr:hypothetical protein [Candidatus Omnitrophota bacterium]